MLMQDIKLHLKDKVMSREMSYMEARELAKTGKKVQSIAMDRDEYVVYESAGFDLKAEDIWNIHNQEQAYKMGGSLKVLPYFIHFNGQHIQMGLDMLSYDVVNVNWIEV